MISLLNSGGFRVGSRGWLKYWLNPRTYTRAARWGYQRASRGYADCDLWSIDSFLCGVLVPGLKQFRNQTNSHPSDLTFEEWQAKVDVIIAGFQAHIDLQEGPPDRFFREVSNKDSWTGLELFDPEGEQAWRAELTAVQQAGLEMFVKWFGHLWD